MENIIETPTTEVVEDLNVEKDKCRRKFQWSQYNVWLGQSDINRDLCIVNLIKKK